MNRIGIAAKDVLAIAIAAASIAFMGCSKNITAGMKGPVAATGREIVGQGASSIILMVPDGMGLADVTAARLFKCGRRIAPFQSVSRRAQFVAAAACTGHALCALHRCHFGAGGTHRHGQARRTFRGSHAGGTESYFHKMRSHGAK